MTEDEWVPIADRVAAAWPSPPMTEERRRLYLDVLGDLRAPDASEAVEQLLREDREDQPPPGVIRSRAAELAQARARTAPPPPPPSAAPRRVAASSITLPGAGEGSASPKGPFNQLAFWGLMLGLAAILVPLSISASIQTANPDAGPRYFPIEMTVLGVVALILGMKGKGWADDRGVGRRLPIAAVVVAVIALIFAFGAFGAATNSAG